MKPAGRDSDQCNCNSLVQIDELNGHFSTQLGTLVISGPVSCASARQFVRFKLLHCDLYEYQSGQMLRLCKNIKDGVGGIHDGHLT